MIPPVSARSTSVAMLLFFGLTAAAPARANVDASGRWFVEADSVRCQIELSSSGTQLVASGDCFHAGAVDGAGTFDAASGHFSVSGSAEGVCDSFMVDATVAPDGTTFAGTFLCLALQLFPVRGNVTGSRCGDGLPACAIDDALGAAIEGALRDDSVSGTSRVPVPCASISRHRHQGCWRCASRILPRPSPLPTVPLRSRHLRR